VFPLAPACHFLTYGGIRRVALSYCSVREGAAAAWPFMASGAVA